MDHTEALNKMLAHACPCNWEGNRKSFLFETHCVTWEVWTESNGDETYNIISVEVYNYA